MKSKVSISIDKELLEQVNKVLKQGLFRNKSHVIEYSVRKFLAGKDEQQ